MRSQLNVWGVFRSGPGIYTPYFITPLPNANYAVVGVTGGIAGQDPYIKFPFDGTIPRENAFDFAVVNNNVASPGWHPPVDQPFVAVTVFGG